MKSNSTLIIFFNFIPTEIKNKKGVDISSGDFHQSGGEYKYKTTVKNPELQNPTMEVFRELARKNSGIRFCARMIQ